MSGRPRAIWILTPDTLRTTSTNWLAFFCSISSRVRNLPKPRARRAQNSASTFFDSESCSSWTVIWGSGCAIARSVTRTESMLPALGVIGARVGAKPSRRTNTPRAPTGICATWKRPESSLNATTTFPLARTSAPATAWPSESFTSPNSARGAWASLVAVAPVNAPATSAYLRRAMATMESSRCSDCFHQYTAPLPVRCRPLGPWHDTLRHASRGWRMSSRHPRTGPIHGGPREALAPSATPPGVSTRTAGSPEEFPLG